jgi:hypothetical protein
MPGPIWDGLAGLSPEEQPVNFQMIYSNQDQISSNIKISKKLQILLEFDQIKSIHLIQIYSIG